MVGCSFVVGLLMLRALPFSVFVFYGLFVIGLIGFVYSAHLLGCLIFIELCLLGMGPLALFFCWMHGSAVGAVIAITLISLGAAEAAVGLGFVIATVLQLRSDDFGRMRFLQYTLLWNSLGLV